jgi:hypothetical protein
VAGHIFEPGSRAACNCTAARQLHSTQVRTGMPPQQTSSASMWMPPPPCHSWWLLLSAFFLGLLLLAEAAVHGVGTQAPAPASPPAPRPRLPPPEGLLLPHTISFPLLTPKHVRMALLFDSQRSADLVCSVRHPPYRSQAPHDTLGLGRRPVQRPCHWRGLPVLVLRRLQPDHDHLPCHSHVCCQVWFLQTDRRRCPIQRLCRHTSI